MTHENGKSNGDREARVNALLDGELDKESIVELKLAASEDQALARTIIEAYELQRGMEQLRIEKAPASLQRKLRQIPASERPVRLRPRWMMAGALAVVPLLVIGIALLQPRQPSAAEVEQARIDLAVAFAYLDKVGDRAGNHIHDVVGRELRSSVKDNISKHFPYTEQSRREEST
jgi:hypothetical protein